MFKHCSLKKTGPSYDQKLVWSGLPGQNVWNKVEEFNKIGQR